MDFGRYWVPGPVEVRTDVLAAMVQPMFHHRGREADELFARIQPGLRAIFGTRESVFVLTASGTGAIEAGVRALPAGRLLALVNGAFSERFARIAEACGHEVERFAVEWGEAHDPATVAARLGGGGHDGVIATHSETSTGALQPLAALARAAGDLPFLVDSVSGAGGAPVDLDANGLAYACSSSQKALALPPGLGFAAPSRELLERAAGASRRGFFLDLVRYAERQPPFTPALPLLHALAFQLDRIAREGLAARLARHQEMAERTWRWAAEHGLEVLAPPGARSPTVSCIRLPGGRNGLAFVAAVAERGYTVGKGYGKLAPTTFRIGHMGDQTPETLDGLLDACTVALAAPS